MFRKLGFGSGSKKRPKKKRLSPAAHDQDATKPPPSYQYAMNEYAMTGPSSSARRPASQANVDDEGTIRPGFSMTTLDEGGSHSHIQSHSYGQILPDPSESQPQGEDPPQSGTVGGVGVGVGVGVGGSDVHDETMTTSNVRLHEQQQRQQQQRQYHHHPRPISTSPLPGDGILRSSSYLSQGNAAYSPHARRRFLSPKAEYFSYDEDDTITTATFGGNYDELEDDDERAMRRGIGGIGMIPPHSEQMMPDATYEEWYGDAYVGGPIRYIYPSGYQSMRPRGSPWKLSIVVCLLFTWLSVFIIGHCSDIYDMNQMNGNNSNKNNNNNNNYNADDANYDDADVNYEDMVINEKWCGSRLLYWMWVISMLITGLASAYCGVIGYIKVRDFAVANTRSQPPGIMMVGDYSLSGDPNHQHHHQHHQTKGNSDYYVPIGDSAGRNSRLRHQQQQAPGGATNYRLQQTHPAQYQKTIYQADGTPQFWGNQIYRPNQAAVHIVSR